MRKTKLIGIVLLMSQLCLAQEYNQAALSPKLNQTAMQGLRTVAYFVVDLNKAKVWYAKAFEAEPYFDEPYYVGFNIGGYELG